MAARSIGSGTISFGLVAIPVRLYVATHSESLSFNMLHESCGSRVKQQLYCPKHERVVERSEIVKGYEFQKDRYVTFTADEMKALEAETTRTIDIQEFVPLAKVDPLYFEDARYLGPDKGAEKAYHLLLEAMRDTGQAAVAQFTGHGKEHIVLIRPHDEALVMHSLYYADEVRGTKEVGVPEGPRVRPGEVELARKLIEQLSNDEFRPDQYHDAYRERVQAVVERKVAGEEITVAAAAEPQAQVIDLMQALKQSLARRQPRRTEASAPRSAAETDRKGRQHAVGGRAASPRRRARKG